ncbi:C6 zinc finger domain protein [Penicillium hispanicum]|uniref:C6 zinc finger domain protein n=1 Tax=Penicillium hispanicum TaxID=1080232 RepID=UPI0025424B90|nr:C6 zinc finger domain protein [Penicillium hispanicum]KAJ5578719.1 C6 zinc finger domain protein [Penicillium hispanicum]
MVGVPGRSKGCNTCIQRKIKCDQGPVPCLNCRKSNRLCTGYKRRLGYIFSHDVVLAGPTDTSEEFSVTHHGRWRKGEPQAPAKISTTRAYRPLQPDPPVSLGCQISSTSTIREQLHYVMVERHTPGELLKNRPQSSSTNWLLQLQGMAIQSSALEDSMTAFLAARVGRIMGDSDLIYKGRGKYIDGLEKLQQALRNPLHRLADETLAACMALSYYELIEGSAGSASSDGAYEAHMRGAVMLLKLRGSEACGTSPLGHALFLALRVVMLLKSLDLHRGTFLAEPEWLTKPWGRIPKSAVDRVYDIIGEMPLVFQQIDELDDQADTDKAAQTSRVLAIVTKCLQVDHALRQSNYTFEESNSGPLYWPELSSLEADAERADGLGKVFPVSFHFSTFNVAEVMTAYWSGMMIVHCKLQHLYARLTALYPSNAKYLVQSREHGEIAREVISNICQSAEYLLQEKLGGAGPMTLLAPLRGCRNYLESMAEGKAARREIAWLNEFIGRTTRRFEFPISRALEKTVICQETIA